MRPTWLLAVMAVILVASLPSAQTPRPPIVPPVITAPAGSAAVEQTTQGERPAATIVASFDGLGVGFEGPHGMPMVRNPSDNALAVGPDHVVQIVNTRMAIFTKKGRRFDTTGRVLWGAAPTNLLFKGFGGMCETTNNGDAVARYDQLAKRWLIVMPIFRRGAARPDQPPEWTARPDAYLSPPGRPGQPGEAVRLPDPPAASPAAAAAPAPPAPAAPAAPQAPRPAPREAPTGPYSMCYAVSTGPDPMGPYHRYEFLRPLFPDYPRPAIWTDGYYVPTSTGDDPISETIATQKHACVADRAKMLRGEPATEQCVILNNVGFLNNADIDGTSLPPAGAPNIMMAAGGVQLRKQFESDRIDIWQFTVNWANPAATRVTAQQPIAVAPYHYLCDGQLSHCVPQPGTESRLDAQGDKIMSRLVYRKIGRQESVVAVHSVNTTAGGGGVRWYEFRVGAEPRRAPAPAGHLRARRVVPVDGEPRHRQEGEHRHRLLVRRRAALRRTTRRRPPGGRPARPAHAARSGPRRGRGLAVGDAVGGLHDDGDRSGRRLHDLVRRRLHEEGRRELLHPHRGIQDAGVRKVQGVGTASRATSRSRRTQSGRRRCRPGRSSCRPASRE